MKATKFEVRHQTLLHLILVMAAFSTYLIQRDDVVWAWIKDSPQNRLTGDCVVGPMQESLLLLLF